ncbi:MAG: RNA polymerase sigma factor [Oscillospiraceae bacterium]|nr:RNA polymerase sigma factor [Oscillospiraceae bacterium]
MNGSLSRTDKEIAELFERHYRMLYRICFTYMKNAADTEDAVQETFYRLISRQPLFDSPEHEKAWLIRTASNICRNALKHWWRKHEDLADHEDAAESAPPETGDVLQAVMSLPEKYKTAVYLYYYEGYSSAETAELLQKPPSTIRNYLHEARAILRERLGVDYDDED